MAADFGGAGHTSNPEVVSAACNFYVEAAFDLSQVLVELPAKIGETAVVSRLQDEFLGYLYGVQGLAVRPLRIVNNRRMQRRTAYR
jgi:TATA-binding protein-associated factor Taf7